MRVTLEPADEPMAEQRRKEGAARRGRSVCPTLRPRQGVTTTGMDFLHEGARTKARNEEFKDVKTDAEKKVEKEKFLVRLAEHQRRWSDEGYQGKRYREECGAKGWTFDELRKTCHPLEANGPLGAEALRPEFVPQ